MPLHVNYLYCPDRVLGIKYKLIGYCEIEKRASKAYSLLHNVHQELNFWDIEDLKNIFEKYKLKHGDKSIDDNDNFNKFYCEQIVPDFDLMLFGFPCVDFSREGKQKGVVDGEHPVFYNLFFNNLNKNNEGKTKLTRSGLFYRALQIAIWKKPMFMIAENVDNMIKGHKYDFDKMMENVKEAGYNIYQTMLNSRDFGIPQNRKRVILVMIRNDLSMIYTFPTPKPKKEMNPYWLKDWLEDDVSDEYYVDMAKDTKLVEKLKGEYDFQHKRGYIGTITTPWGIPTYDRQCFVKDESGIRCLTSEELMAFQGFKKAQGTMLREAGFSKREIGKMVGNTITVPVIQAVIDQLIKCM